MRWGLYFKHRYNKILAVTFATLAVGFFLAEVVIFYFGQGGLVVNSPNAFLRLVYFIFLGGILSYLLVTNINNDPRAYQAILMWIFWFIIDEIQAFFYSYSLFNVIKEDVGFIKATLAIGQPAMSLLCLALGIVLYVTVRRYMFYSLNKFSTVRLFAIVYTVVLTLSYVLETVLVILMGAKVGLADIFLIVSKSCADIAMVFTLERLRRL